MKKLLAGFLLLLTAILPTACSSLPETVSPTEAAIATQADEASKLLKDFPVIPQLPELPTGCEITCLAMVLNYYGFAADKCDLADNYLEKSEDYEADFHKVFVGNPRDEDAYGCYAPVIEDAANRYLTDAGSTMLAVDVSGTELDKLVGYIDIGVPVVVWGTMNCAEGYYTDTWEADGVEVSWYWPEHAMVLIGYSDTRIWVADSLKNKVLAFDRDLFKTRYEELGKQAVVVQ